jgi:hypothetical protein
MHGFVSAAMLNAQQRKFVGLRASKKSINEIDSFKPRTLWQKFEV